MQEEMETGIPCIMQGCAGTYERREILHCVERADEVVCIDHVPALVCDVCGDVQFEAETVRRLQVLLEARGEPDKHLPTYEFNRSASAA
ncbi:MAG: YgiT-type zinc finger protein [Rhodothermales bacterium]